jgi:hypothetical protein
LAVALSLPSMLMADRKVSIEAAATRRSQAQKLAFAAWGV